jgi:hypothetical protein
MTHLAPPREGMLATYTSTLKDGRRIRTFTGPINTVKVTVADFMHENPRAKYRTLIEDHDKGTMTVELYIPQEGQ